MLHDLFIVYEKNKDHENDANFTISVLLFSSRNEVFIFQFQTDVKLVVCQYPW